MANATAERPPSITDPQREVIVLIAAGCSNDEVGERLGISPRTVKAHCDVLRQKLGVRRRRQLPIAYRSLTGDDPLAQGLDPRGSGGWRRGGRGRPRRARGPGPLPPRA